MFDIDTRVKMAKESVKHIDGVKVVPFETLLVNFCEKENINFVIRGLRAVSDFEFELQMGYANSSLNSKIETIYLMPNLNNAFISSSVVRSILKHNGNADHLIPESIIPHIKEVKKCM